MLKAIVSVEYSDCSDIEEDLQEENISITPLHANINKYEAINEECSQFWKEMLDKLELELDSNKLYHTIFEVELSWDKDYWGEVDSSWDVKLIDHEAIGGFNEDNDLTYYSESDAKTLEEDMVRVFNLK